jgi:hypothetical protein
MGFVQADHVVFLYVMKLSSRPTVHDHLVAKMLQDFCNQAGIAQTRAGDRSESPDVY